MQGQKNIKYSSLSFVLFLPHEFSKLPRSFECAKCNAYLSVCYCARISIENRKLKSR